MFLLTEFDLAYTSLKSVKGSIVVDHLAAYPVLDESEITNELPNDDIMFVHHISGSTRWQMYFDGASNQYGHGVGALLIAPDGTIISWSMRLCFEDGTIVTNNVAEYEPCILGLEMALEFGILELNLCRLDINS